MSALTLTEVPGFSDLPDLVLTALNPAFGVHVGKIAQNAAFGMVGVEVFSGFYKNGDTIPLPSSNYDGYPFSRNELIYIWATQTSYNPTTGWITGPDNLYYATWKVDQVTGEVATVEVYRKSDPASPAIASSNDGVLQVFTVGVRQKSALSLVTAPSFVDIPDADIAVDKPWHQSLVQQLNENAKFATVSSEVIYMGEFGNGDTVPQPVSPADLTTYAYANTKFMFSWRWTAAFAAFAQPNLADGQLGPMLASINASTGAVSVTVKMVNGGLHTVSGAGRIAVFAFCRRSPGTLALSNSFTEQTIKTFLPPKKLRASTITALNKNIREAVQNPEFFGPASYKHGDTVTLPTGADGYPYNANEITYIWEWEDTTPESGSNLRVAAWYGWVGPTGAVSLKVFRLPPGGPYVEETTTGNIRIRVLTVATRQRPLTPPSPSLSGSAPGDATSGGAGTVGVSVDGKLPGIQPYAPGFYTGYGRILDANEVVMTHIVAGNLTSATWPSALTGSNIQSFAAATASTVFTIAKIVSGVTTTIGTATFAIGATAASFSFSSAVTLVPGNIITITAPATPDATLSGVFGTLSATRI